MQFLHGCRIKLFSLFYKNNVPNIIYLFNNLNNSQNQFKGIFSIKFQSRKQNIRSQQEYRSIFLQFLVIGESCLHMEIAQPCVFRNFSPIPIHSFQIDIKTSQIHLIFQNKIKIQINSTQITQKLLIQLLQAIRIILI
ncbi:hypothetical protein TTHERM_000647237 (macronuclear) [Tetrahymena thermophila SB210]|uniref:Uncharacterized protein n=1 Tax=Tetrahymena thermophila (strain SB210) TaxID=312017 RepID=W7WW75_TETTS|nr:hypothetical protein TTHERM_000647237 [Tetrahymena thermophila SB210]EWS71085.1 hypothetical protein TTHERM_000647237 [Tetrahymena thermophila SB210]|eukprot:XP_012656384.1 hypothetical protein TTHERM_000647237 [Tetrahymena thermophila SB210]